jgi:hypothetical protein
MNTSSELISLANMNIRSSSSSFPPAKRTVSSPITNGTKHHQQQLPSIQTQVWFQQQPQHHPAHLPISPPNMLSTEPPDLDQEDDEYEVQQGQSKKTEKARWTVDEVPTPASLPIFDLISGSNLAASSKVT